MVDNEKREAVTRDIKENAQDDRHFLDPHNDVYKEGVTRSGELMLPVATATSRIRDLSERRIEILGLEAFILTERTRQPSLENSIDISIMDLARLRQSSWEVAEEFLLRRENSKMFFLIIAADWRQKLEERDRNSRRGRVGVSQEWH